MALWHWLIGIGVVILIWLLVTGKIPGSVITMAKFLIVCAAVGAGLYYLYIKLVEEKSWN